MQKSARVSSDRLSFKKEKLSLVVSCTCVIVQVINRACKKLKNKIVNLFDLLSESARWIKTERSVSFRFVKLNVWLNATVTLQKQQGESKIAFVSTYLFKQRLSAVSYIKSMLSEKHKPVILMHGDDWFVLNLGINLVRFVY